MQPWGGRPAPRPWDLPLDSPQWNRTSQYREGKMRESMRPRSPGKSDPEMGPEPIPRCPQAALGSPVHSRWLRLCVPEATHRPVADSSPVTHMQGNASPVAACSLLCTRPATPATHGQSHPMCTYTRPFAQHRSVSSRTPAHNAQAGHGPSVFPAPTKPWALRKQPRLVAIVMVPAAHLPRGW